MTKLHCFAIRKDPPKIVPAVASRQWMDDFTDRHAYRCLPLTIANTHSWDILCPMDLTIDWNGGSLASDLVIVPSDSSVCRSHFTKGIVTFHTDYIFRTDDEWDILATGSFNSPKDGIYPLTGIIESNWLSYPFTMNWQMTRPGTVTFQKDEPFCSIFPIKKQAILDFVPEIYDISSDIEMKKQYEDFVHSRNEFMSTIGRQAWLKHYFKGTHSDGIAVDKNNHINKLRVAIPVDRRNK